MFDFRNDTYTADYSLSSATLPSGLPTWQTNDDQAYETYTPAQTSNPVAAPTGSFFGDALKSVTATAGAFLDGVSKIYALDNQISSTKLQQKQIESGLRLNELKTVGALDLQTAQLAANRDIGLLQAQEAVTNERARVQSSQGASIVSIPSAIPTPLILIAGLIGIYFFSKRGAA